MIEVHVYTSVRIGSAGRTEFCPEIDLLDDLAELKGIIKYHGNGLEREYGQPTELIDNGDKRSAQGVKGRHNENGGVLHDVPIMVAFNAPDFSGPRLAECFT